MKKLLYIFTLALLVVACDKNYDEQFEEVAIVAPEVSATQDEISDEAIYSIVDDILNGTYSTSKKGTAASANKGGDYVKVYVFSQDSKNYLILNDESNDDLCIDIAVNAFDMFFDNSAGDGSVLTVEAPEGTPRLSLTGNFAGFFDAGLNSIRQHDPATDVAVSIDFDADNSATFSN